jgi:hypothetical protein
VVFFSTTPCDRLSSRTSQLQDACALGCGLPENRLADLRPGVARVPNHVDVDRLLFRGQRRRPGACDYRADRGTAGERLAGLGGGGPRERAQPLNCIGRSSQDPCWHLALVDVPAIDRPRKKSRSTTSGSGRLASCRSRLHEARACTGISRRNSVRSVALRCSRVWYIVCPQSAVQPQRQHAAFYEVLERHQRPVRSRPVPPSGWKPPKPLLQM